MMADDAEQASGEGKKSKKLLIIIIALVVLLFAGGSVAAWLLMSGDEGPQAEEVVPADKNEAIYVKLRTMQGKPYFIANFTGDKFGSQRFLQVYVEALTRDPLVQAALEKHMPLIVHSLTTLFSSQSLADMQTAEGKERLRQQAAEKVKEIMQSEIGRPGIEDVYFTNFVMQ